MRHVESIHVLGDYWHPRRPVRTGTGELVHRAKDRGDAAATAELCERFAGLVQRLEATAGPPSLVVAVPASPARAGAGQGEHLASVLARALAEAGAGNWCPELLARDNDTPRLRHLDPSLRADAASRAGYRVCGPVAGRRVVLVDDVLLTGATVDAVAACLGDAGAESVAVAVAARTRAGVEAGSSPSGAGRPATPPPVE